ncbi:hypothetical protein K1719_010282 [Acacia pycnantha]|nr:hypothetical protein K1719_010282 [Acacia pycnantha]
MMARSTPAKRLKSREKKELAIAAASFGGSFFGRGKGEEANVRIYVQFSSLAIFFREFSWKVQRFNLFLPLCMARTGLFDLEKHFAFYGAYHSNPIFFSALLILYFVPPFFDIPDFEFSLFGHDFVLVWNLGFVVALVYAVFYASLDPKAGSLAALLCIIYWVASSLLAYLCI